MKYAVNSKEMKEIDAYTVEQIKLPALVLMERAAYAAVELIKKKLKKEDRILVVCGPGNNGGDGVAAGRILFLQGYRVALLFVCDENTFSSQMRQQTEIAKNLGIPLENNIKPGEYNIIIDAIFGVGLSRPVEGVYETAIQAINSCKGVIYAIDIPSGISSDTGKVMNIAVRADYTVTFGYMKQGLLLYPGAEYAGEITVADIGFPEEALRRLKPDTFYYEREELKLLPSRPAYSNKGTYGRVLVIAGKTGMSGAAYLSAKAAYRTGAGLVKVLTSSDNRSILQTLLPEALFSTYDQGGRDKEDWMEEITGSILWASAIVIGPGLGLSSMSMELMQLAINRTAVPLIIDADALNMLAELLNKEGLSSPEDRMKKLEEMLPEGTILTPHLREFSRISSIPVTTIVDNLIDTARQCSYNNKLIYVLKDARTVIAGGGKLCINCSGNNGMATGGSGDVLTGIIAALLAQGMSPYEASCLAVYIHGLAGDKAADEKGTYSLMAGDLLEGIAGVLHVKEQEEV
jgi:NAD(P)H-hydrate epimerase